MDLSPDLSLRCVCQQIGIRYVFQMNTNCVRNLHVPVSVIQRIALLYAWFNLSLRDVEEFMAERGVEVSYETVRLQVARCGALIVRRRGSAGARVHPQ